MLPLFHTAPILLPQSKLVLVRPVDLRILLEISVTQQAHRVVKRLAYKLAC